MTVTFEKLVGWWRDITTVMESEGAYHVYNTILIPIPIRWMNALHAVLSNLFRSVLILTLNLCVSYNMGSLPISPLFAFILFTSSLIQRILAPGKLSPTEDSSVLGCDAVSTYPDILNECQETLAQQCGVTSQKTLMFNAAVETTYHTWDNTVRQKFANVERQCLIFRAKEEQRVELSIYWMWRQ